MGHPASAFEIFSDKPRELVIGDPHAQPGLVAHITNSVGPVRVINFYHFHLWPKEKAYCAKCGAHRHRDGFTIELDDGTWALVGSKCAGDLWGEHWKTVRKRFQKEIDEVGIILDVRPVLAELESIRAKLDNTWRPIVEQAAAHQRRFKGMMKPLYDALKRAADRPDHCVVINGNQRLFVEGWPFFALDDILRQFQLALEEIDVAIGVGRGKHTDLGGRTVRLGDARYRLDVVAHAVRGLRNFFAPRELMHFGNLIDGAAESLGAMHSGRYRVEGLRIVDLVTKQSIEMPDHFSVFNTEPLRRLRNLKS